MRPALIIVGAVAVLSAILMAVDFRATSTSQPEQVSPDPERYRLVFRHCWFEAPWQETIRCADLHTPASTGSFILPVVIIEDRGAGKPREAVFYLQGGPGSSADLDQDGIAYWLRWRDTMALGRDLVLLDPRGTGRSTPVLQCQAYDELSLSILKRNVSVLEELREGYAVLEQCFAQLRQAAQPFDPDHYGTLRHAQDVGALLDLLPYDQWNLLGVSYGTRVALEVARQREDQVRSLVLDSVYPLDQGGMLGFPAVLDQAFRNFFQWCEEQCGVQRSIERSLELALRQLRDAPMTLTVPRRDGEAPVDLVINDHRFISAVFAALYSKHRWSRIPEAIDAVLDNNPSALMPIMEPFVHMALSEDFFSLVFMAVDCRDHGISSQEAYQQELEKYPRWQDYTRDLWHYQACHFISAEPAVQVAPSALPPVPGLLLAGELDPITPAAWAENLHQQWPESQLHVLPDTGHAVINTDDCVYQSLRSFIDEPSRPVSLCGE